jgi:hypothetical protein
MDATCERCGKPAVYEVQDANGGGPFVAVCGDACADALMAHADGCDCQTCDTGTVHDFSDVPESVLDADLDANVVDEAYDCDARGDMVQRASVVAGDDGRVWVLVSNHYGQRVAYAHATMSGAMARFQAVTADYEDRS